MSKHSSKGAAWEALRIARLEMDGYLCQYCGREATTVDHVVPKVLGGEDVLDNLVSACLPCNGKKSGSVLLRESGFNPAWLDSLW